MVKFCPSRKSRSQLLAYQLLRKSRHFIANIQGFLSQKHHWQKWFVTNGLSTRNYLPCNKIINKVL